ncbi:MAG TPA: hypothetical protein VNM48_19165 [Chloroflexota bacterium]|nr:hypothetical protein [Chloroflexota bacterium]
MATTSTTNLALIKPTQNTNEPASIFTSHNPNMDAIDAHDHATTKGVPIKRVQSGTFAARPAAGNAGHVYVATDTGQAFFDTGAAWKEAASLTAAGVPSCRAFHSATQSIPHATPTALAFNSERFDTDAIHDTATNNSRFTCKTAGKYIITGHVEWSANATGVRQLRIVLNGATPLIIVAVTTPVGAGYQGVATIADLAVNDYVELQAYQDSGSALTISTPAQYGCEFMMTRIG